MANAALVWVGTSKQGGKGSWKRSVKKRLTIRTLRCHGAGAQQSLG